MIATTTKSRSSSKSGIRFQVVVGTMPVGQELPKKPEDFPSEVDYPAVMDEVDTVEEAVEKAALVNRASILAQGQEDATWATIRVKAS